MRPRPGGTGLARGWRHVEEHSIRRGDCPSPRHDATTGCNPDPEAEAAGEAAEDRAEAIAEEEGYGPLDEHIQGEVGELRGELAHDVNGEIVDDDGRTAAERIDDAEDGETEETGY